MTSDDAGRRQQFFNYQRQKAGPKRGHVVVTLARADAIYNHVLRGVSEFIAKPPLNHEHLPANISAEIKWLLQGRYLAEDNARRCLDFWGSLEKVYGPAGNPSPELVRILLDTWQSWLRQTEDLTEAELLTMSLRWLEEFDKSNIGLRARKKELFTFRTERIREAAHYFLRMHQAQVPGIAKVSDIRRLRERAIPVTETRKPARRTSSQPIYIGHMGAHFGRNFISMPDEFMGNREDYWPYPKER